MRRDVVRRVRMQRDFRHRLHKGAVPVAVFVLFAAVALAAQQRRQERVDVARVIVDARVASRSSWCERRAQCSHDAAI